MTTDAFIRMTQNVIAKDGFEDYLPTLVLIGRPAVLALQGVPDTVDLEKASREWAAKNVGESSEDYFLAFKINPREFKVVTRIGGVIEEKVAPAKPG
jgi:hypothetical protein